MKAIQTFWNITGNPFKAVGNFLTAEYGLQSWALSAHFLDKFGYKPELYTNSDSLPFLEKLNFPYHKIHTDLDRLKGKVIPPTFGMAKIYAYSLQNEPFFSLDLDAVFFKDVLREKGCLSEPLLSQNLEDDEVKNIENRKYYKRILDLMKRESAIMQDWLKKPVRNYPCMAVYLCNDLEFNRRYCYEAFRFYIENRKLFLDLEFGKVRNRHIKNIPTSKNRKCFSVIPEQYLAGQLANETGKNFSGLFEKFYNYDFTEFDNSGYIHLWGSKQDKKLAQKIDEMCGQEIPQTYFKIKELVN